MDTNTEQQVPNPRQRHPLQGLTHEAVRQQVIRLEQASLDLRYTSLWLEVLGEEQAALERDEDIWSKVDMIGPDNLVAILSYEAYKDLPEEQLEATLYYVERIRNSYAPIAQAAEELKANTPPHVWFWAINVLRKYADIVAFVPPALMEVLRQPNPEHGGAPVDTWGQEVEATPTTAQEDPQPIYTPAEQA